MVYVKQVVTALTVAMMLMTTGCGVELNGELISTVKEAKGLLQDQRAILKKDSQTVVPIDESKKIEDNLVRQIFAQIGYDGDPEAVMMSFHSDNRGGDPGHLMTMVRHSGSLSKFLNATETQSDTNVSIFTPSGKYLLKLVRVPAETSPPWVWSAVPRGWEKSPTLSGVKISKSSWLPSMPIYKGSIGVTVGEIVVSTTSDAESITSFLFHISGNPTVRLYNGSTEVGTVTNPLGDGSVRFYSEEHIPPYSSKTYRVVADTSYNDSTMEVKFLALFSGHERAENEMLLSALLIEDRKLCCAPPFINVDTIKK